MFVIHRNIDKKLCNFDFRHNKKLTKLGIDLNQKKKVKHHSRSNHNPRPFPTSLRIFKDDGNIAKPDKSRGVVILNEDDYLIKRKTILNDTSKFKQIISHLSTEIRTLIKQ